MLILVFTGWVMIVNRNSVNMTGRQKVLKAVYPAMMWITKITGVNNKVLSSEKKAPPVSFYSLKTVLTDGSPLDLSAYKGKKILLVNTASECGYTAQYNQLQELYNRYNDKLVVIAFPANDFKEQEKGSDAEIAAFCKKNYGVSFPLAQKTTVIKTAGQNPVFQWLTDAAQNGWSNQAPEWNFSKYLVNEEGVLTHYFGPSVEPMSDQVLKAIQ